MFLATVVEKPLGWHGHGFSPALSRDLKLDLCQGDLLLFLGTRMERERVGSGVVVG